MENEIRERSVEVDGMTLTLLHKDGKWVFPLVTYYQHGLGTPLCLALLAYVEDSNEFESETVITVNLPGAERSAGCQFIDTNNNGEEVLDWLMLYGLCTFPAHLQSSVFKLSKDLIDSIHEEGIVAYTS